MMVKIEHKLGCVYEIKFKMQDYNEPNVHEFIMAIKNPESKSKKKGYWFKILQTDDNSVTVGDDFWYGDEELETMLFRKLSDIEAKRLKLLCGV